MWPGPRLDPPRKSGPGAFVFRVFARCPHRSNLRNQEPWAHGPKSVPVHQVNATSALDRTKLWSRSVPCYRFGPMSRALMVNRLLISPLTAPPGPGGDGKQRRDDHIRRGVHVVLALYLLPAVLAVLVFGGFLVLLEGLAPDRGPRSARSRRVPGGQPSWRLTRTGAGIVHAPSFPPTAVPGLGDATLDLGDE
jgi:hypothetical protein